MPGEVECEVNTKQICFSEINPFVRYVQRLLICRETYPSFSNVRPYDCRIFYVAEGEGTLRIEREVHHLARGQAMLWLSGVRYYIRSSEEKPLILLGANFDFTQELRHLTVPIPPDPVFAFDTERIWEHVEFKDFPKLNQPVHLHNMQAIEKPLLEMLTEYKTQKLYCDRRLSSMMMNILVLIARNIALSDFGRNTSVAKIEEVLNYIHQHYTENIDNISLGALFNYHPNYLNRQVKLYTGRSLHQYLIHYRIARAIDLLVATDKPVAEIATEVGFSELSHFSKIFRQKTGASPSALRTIEVSPWNMQQI